jgi:hypothetical protein
MGERKGSKGLGWTWPKQREAHVFPSVFSFKPFTLFETFENSN